MYSYNPYYEEYLAHYGVLGMKWGIRRYQPYTKGQKGVFKGLKKDYKKQKKVLKAQRKYYLAKGDTNKADSINRSLDVLKKSYKKNVKEIESKFDKENWETYKEKIANTGSMKEVEQLKGELSANQLWNAANRFKAENELMRAKYDYDGKVEKLKNVAETINAGVSIARAGLNAADIVRTIHNMNSPDNEYKALSKEATVTKAAERAKTLKDVPDTRMPKSSGERKEAVPKEFKDAARNAVSQEANRSNNNSHKDNSKTYTTPKGTTETTSKKEEPKWQTYNLPKQQKNNDAKNLFTVVKNYEPSESTFNTKTSNIVSLSDNKPQNWIPKATNTTSKKAGSWIDKPVTEAVKSLIPKSVDRYQVKGGDNTSKYANRYSYTKPTSTGSYTTVDSTDEWIKKLQNYSKRED